MTAAAAVHRPPLRRRRGASPTAADADGHWQRGRAAARAGDWGAAVAAFERATARAPDDVLFWVNRGNAERHAGRLDAAERSAARARALAPADPTALHLHGVCLAGLHRYADAAAALAALDDAGHADTGAMLLHATMLRELQRPHDAVPVLLRALMRQPHLVRGHALLADALRSMGRREEAAECMRTVLALAPDDLEARSHLSFEKRHLCDWRDLDDDVQALRALLAPDAAGAGQARVGATFGLLSLPLSAAEHRTAARGDALHAAQGVRPLAALPAPVTATAATPAVIGLLSSDFREHPVAQLLVETLERIDRRRFAVRLYSTGPDDGSPLRARVAAAGDAFVELRGLSDRQAAERIRADAVELLVDLNGLTRGHRLGVLAHRPAPLQAGWLGYPGSTGAAFVDYLVGDPVATPAAAAADASEKIAQLPLCLLPNGRWRPLPQPLARADAGLPDDALVLCAFNHAYKILPPAFDAWCQALREAPAAVLWLKDGAPALRAHLRREAAVRGVAASRLVFAPTVAYADHFSRLALADLFVDTWPYGAHTTAADALWAGVPVLTWAGATTASRVAASVVRAAGLDDFVMASADEYRLALRALVQEPALLDAARTRLRTQRLMLPLFDSAARTRELEDLFDRMLARRRAGLAPEHLWAADAAGAPAAAGIAAK